MKTIICADALDWLDGRSSIGAVITSLPDAEEIGATIGDWRAWFARGVTACVNAASPDAPVMFYQTDRKIAGSLESKSALVINAAHAAGAKLLWHKIVLRRDEGKVDIHRPGYSHLIAVSKNGKPGTASPDVIQRGKMIYPNAMGFIAAGFSIRFAGQSSKVIVDPFCGRGSVPAIAEAMGLDSIGIDIDPAQCDYAKALNLRRV